MGAIRVPTSDYFPNPKEHGMLVGRFNVRCQSAKTDAVAVAMARVAGAARDLLDPDALIATEVFEDRAAMDREKRLAEVEVVVELLQSGALSAPPEWTIYEISSAESPQM